MVKKPPYDYFGRNFLSSKIRSIVTWFTALWKFRKNLSFGDIGFKLCTTDLGTLASREARVVLFIRVRPEWVLHQTSNYSEFWEWAKMLGPGSSEFF